MKEHGQQKNKEEDEKNKAHIALYQLSINKAHVMAAQVFKCYLPLQYAGDGIFQRKTAGESGKESRMELDMAHGVQRPGSFIFQCEMGRK